MGGIPGAIFKSLRKRRSLAFPTEPFGVHHHHRKPKLIINQRRVWRPPIRPSSSFGNFEIGPRDKEPLLANFSSFQQRPPRFRRSSSCSSKIFQFQAEL